MEIYEDEIISIKEIGYEDTIDIEIDSKDRTFFANNILTHNSGMSSNDISMENTSESIGLVFTVDALFGILQDEQMRANGEYKLKAVAVRESDHLNDKKEFKIDYSHMRITEQKSGEVTNTSNEIFKPEDGNLSKQLYQERI